MRRRIDVELVRRGLARSREHAADLVREGRVHVGGVAVAKAATQVDAAAPLTVAAEAGEEWVSRGAHKLIGGLDRFEASGGLRVAGRRCLDAGASTGGFTQVLLHRGADRVVALDVGYGQLAWVLRTDDRVTVIERTNARDMTAETIGGPVDLVVGDLSFISLRVVLPALAGVMAPGADAVLLVKPQFEAGRQSVGKGGVVTDPAVREAAVTSVVTSAEDLGLGLRDVVASPLPGPAGNVEFLVWLAHGESVEPWRDMVAEAVRRGPGAGRSEEVAG